MKTKNYLFIIIFILFTCCTYKINMISYYPPGTNMYNNMGTVSIDVDVNQAGKPPLNTTAKFAREKVIGMNGPSIIYLASEEYQTLDKFIHGAFTSDFNASNLFDVVSGQQNPDYTLIVKVQDHFGYYAVNPLLLFISIVPLFPVMGPLWMPMYKTRAENVMEVSLKDNKGGKIVYKKGFNEKFHKSYSQAGFYAYGYNYSYFRIGQLKKIINMSTDDIAATVGK